MEPIEIEAIYKVSYCISKLVLNNNIFSGRRRCRRLIGMTPGTPINLIEIIHKFKISACQESL